MLEIKNLTKKYDDVTALDKISFSLKEGEITGFLGPNGAGKTTTLKILTGFLDSDSGEVKFASKPLSLYWDKIIGEIGCLPENNPLYQNMRTDEFLTFIAKVKGEKDKSKLRSIAKTCGITEVLTKPIEQLSKGYKQRTGLAKALIGNPKYLLFDEPTAGLDPNQKEEILNLIKRISKNKIVLFSSHELAEVSKIADRVIIIHNGKIVADGKSEDLVREHFIGSKIIVTTDAPIAKFKDQMANIKNISQIEEIKQGKFNSYKINCKDERGIGEKIFEIIVKNKWKLTELHTEKQGLDELFKQLTKGQ